MQAAHRPGADAALIGKRTQPGRRVLLQRAVCADQHDAHVAPGFMDTPQHLRHAITLEPRLVGAAEPRRRPAGQDPERDFRR